MKWRDAAGRAGRSAGRSGGGGVSEGEGGASGSRRRPGPPVLRAGLRASRPRGGSAARAFVGCPLTCLSPHSSKACLGWMLWVVPRANFHTNTKAPGGNVTPPSPAPTVVALGCKLRSLHSKALRVQAVYWLTPPMIRQMMRQ